MREVRVAASPLAPISCAYCLECLNQNCEPKYVVDAMVESVGKLSNTVLAKYRVFVNNRYVLLEDYIYGD